MKSDPPKDVKHNCNTDLIMIEWYRKYDKTTAFESQVI